MSDRDSRLRISVWPACLLMLCLMPSYAADYKPVDERPPGLAPSSRTGPTAEECEMPKPGTLPIDGRDFARERNDFRNEGLDLSAFDPERWHLSKSKSGKAARVIAPARKHFITTGFGYKKMELIGIYHDSNRAKYVVDYETKGALWMSYLLGERYTVGAEEARHRRGRLWCWVNVRF